MHQLRRGIAIVAFVGFALSSRDSLAAGCPEGQYYVKSHGRNDYTKADGTAVSAAIVKKHCRPFRSLLPPEPQFLSDMPKGWPNPKEKFKAWSKAEEAEIKNILQSLPGNLTGIGKIKFHRAVSDFTPNPSASNSEAKTITIYDSIKNHDLKRVVAHELAHILWDSLTEGERADYLKASQWEVNFKLQTMRLLRTTLPIADSVTGPGEDFSNNVELFLFEKSLLAGEQEIQKCLEEMLK